MTSTLPSDPYLALGVPKDASAATIKSTYRKVVLKCHPDKFTDESLKKQKQEEFHKIQEAYELIGDEEKRATYDAQVRLEQLRKEKLARSGPSVEVKTARYDVRTAAPAGATFTAKGPSRYEERKPASRSYEEDRYFEERASRKYETYEAYPKYGSSRSSRPKEEPARSSKPSDRTRSERNRTRDREERRDRSDKFPTIDDESSSNDEKARWEGEYRRRSDDDRRRREEEDARKAAADARRKAEDRRSYEEKEPRRHRSYEEREFDRQRKLSEMENDAVRYIHRSKVEIDPRPSPGRTSSSRDVRPEAYERRSARPDTVRRSSAARPKDRTESSGRDTLRDRKGIPEIVEWEDDRPSFKHTTSSPADIHVPRAMPQRSYTEAPPHDQRRTETSPTPTFRRSETMPSVPPSSSSRRKEVIAPRPSGLRSSESATPREPETTYRTVPAPQPTSNSTKYYYPNSGGGVSSRVDDMGVANGHRTIIREPDRHRTRSPSPLARPPMGSNRPVEKGSSRAASSVFSPTLGRSATFNNSSPVERGRSNLLFGERSSEHSRRENARQTSFSPDSISYTPKIGPEDIRWSPREKDREYATKPTLGRHATFVY